jgi:hypothetical protein
MSTTDRTATSAIPESLGENPRARLLWLALLLLPLSCEGRRGPPGPAGGAGPGDSNPGDDPEPTATEYEVGAFVPELLLEIRGLIGASGPGGEFLPGDVVSVDFTVTRSDGRPWSLGELEGGEALISGPTFNYQRVLPLQDDVLARSVDEGAGHFRYTFAEPLPAAYLAPYNDSPSFGPELGELTGQPLLDGTYTVGLTVRWPYRIGGRERLRVGEDTADFLLGTGAGSLTPRDVVRTENCDRCHTQLEAHDGHYRTMTMCLLCHTVGAEDLNDLDVLDGSPAITVESRVLFHRIHNGRSLPSVNGVGTRGNGARNYGLEPRPLQVVRGDGTIADYSHVGFPALPNRVWPMDRDSGYDGLEPSEKLQEDAIRSGPTQCSLCHGDPDGAGPLEAPVQGDLIYSMLSRRACGSCHDDVDFRRSYRANGDSMPSQSNDNRCTECHRAAEQPLDPRRAHVHPLLDSTVDPGLALELLSVSEAGPADLNGRLEPGEKLRLTLALTDAAGNPAPATDLDELRVVVSGPTANFQLLGDAYLDPAGLVGDPIELLVPERVSFERLGESGPALDLFLTERSPIRASASAPTRVQIRVAKGAGGRLTGVAGRASSFVDLDDASAFRRGDACVLDDGVAGLEEYVRVHLVEGNRVWFGDPEGDGYWPGLRNAHATGTALEIVSLVEAQEGLDYLVDAAGSLTELREPGPGRVLLASYTTDFVVPASYPAPRHDSPDIDELHGEWSGERLIPGTYSVAVLAARDFTTRVGQTFTPYRAAASDTLDFPVLTNEITPAARIADGASCDSCHQELAYHDASWRGFDACLVCHGVSGTEDLARRDAANAPATPGVSVEFRMLIHLIHNGRSSARSDRQVVGEGPAPYPDNFTVRDYHGLSQLPAFPDRTLQCERCHGEQNVSALTPGNRAHPDQGFRPVAVWRPVCATCHDDPAVQAHIDSNTAPGGAEACAICHAPGEFADAAVAHGKAR